LWKPEASPPAEREREREEREGVRQGVREIRRRTGLSEGEGHSIGLNGTCHI